MFIFQPKVSTMYALLKRLLIEKKIKNIAGIINKKGNVLGMMPHPERATNRLSRLNDGENFFLSIAETLQ